MQTNLCFQEFPRVFQIGPVWGASMPSAGIYGSVSFKEIWCEDVEIVQSQKPRLGIKGQCITHHCHKYEACVINCMKLINKW